MASPERDETDANFGVADERNSFGRGRCVEKPSVAEKRHGLSVVQSKFASSGECYRGHSKLSSVRANGSRRV